MVGEPHLFPRGFVPFPDDVVLQRDESVLRQLVYHLKQQHAESGDHRLPLATTTGVVGTLSLRTRVLTTQTS